MSQGQFQETQKDTMAPPPTQIPLTLIVAATPKNGIGKNGALPWPMLKKEMAYFARVTKRVPAVASEQGPRRNAVIMGRKTWDSIPPKFRPLKDRTNIVISSQSRSAIEGVTEEVVVSSSVVDGLRELQTVTESGKVPVLGRAFVIGGARIYGDVMGLEQTKHVLLTRIGKEYDCDTFFPDLESSKDWERRNREVLEEFVGEEVKEGGEEEQDVGFEFQLWERGQ